MYIGFPGASVVKNPPGNAGDAGDLGLILGSGRSPGGGHGNPFQYLCLKNPMNSLAGSSPWGCKESDMTEVTTCACACTHTHTHTVNMANHPTLKTQKMGHKAHFKNRLKKKVQMRPCRWPPWML